MREYTNTYPRCPGLEFLWCLLSLLLGVQVIGGLGVCGVLCSCLRSGRHFCCLLLRLRRGSFHLGLGRRRCWLGGGRSWKCRRLGISDGRSVRGFGLWWHCGSRLDGCLRGRHAIDAGHGMGLCWCLSWFAGLHRLLGGWGFTHSGFLWSCGLSLRRLGLRCCWCCSCWSCSRLGW